MTESWRLRLPSPPSKSALRCPLETRLGPLTDKAATARIQHILIDFAKADNNPRILMNPELSVRRPRNTS
jgi:hypothetical protein